MPRTERVRSTNQRERDEHEGLILELEKALRIDKNALDDALEQQADLVYRVSKALTLEVSKRDATKQEISEIEAEADEKLRATGARTKDKMTETEYKMQVRLDPDVKRVNQDLLRANRRVAELQALKDSFKDKSYAMKELVELYVAQYWGGEAGSSSRNAGAMKDRDAAIARQGMAQARREYRRDRD